MNQPWSAPTNRQASANWAKCSASEQALLNAGYAPQDFSIEHYSGVMESVTIRHMRSGVSVTCNEHDSYFANKATAMDRLAGRLLSN